MYWQGSAIIHSILCPRRLYFAVKKILVQLAMPHIQCVGDFRRHEISAVRKGMLLGQYVIPAAAGSGRSLKQGRPAASNLISYLCFLFSCGMGVVFVFEAIIKYNN